MLDKVDCLVGSRAAPTSDFSIRIIKHRLRPRLTGKLRIADAKLFWNLSFFSISPQFGAPLAGVTPETIISAAARVYAQPQNPDRRFAQASLLR
jgi:hypothetical protein